MSFSFERRRFVADGPTLVAPAADYEVDMLRSMVEQLIMLVTDEAPDHDDHDGAASPSGDDHFSIWERELSEHDDDLPDDPALDRLFPSAAYNSPDEAAEFRRHTLGALVERKVDDARAVLECLGRRAHAEQLVTVPVDTVPAWIRTITALRLVLGARLGIESSDDIDALAEGMEDEERQYTFAVFVWLEDWLEGMLKVL